MPKERKSDRDKLLDQIKFLNDKSGRNAIGLWESKGLLANSNDNEYGPHTVLKLAYLNYYLGLFTRIANRWKKENLFDKIIFIDAFGGSGLVKVRGSKYLVLGSSVLAALNPLFDEVISVEIDPLRAKLLEERLEAIAPGRTSVHEGDVNSLLKGIVSKEVSKRTIVMFFVDPEGMEPNFTELRYLMDQTKYVDIIMNFTWGVYRLNGRILAHFNANDISRMKTLIPTYEPGKDPTDATLRMFEEMFGKPYGDMIEIKSSGNKTEYSLILRIRKTQSGTAWLAPIMEFGKIISAADGDLALELLRQANGDSTSLF